MMQVNHPGNFDSIFTRYYGELVGFTDDLIKDREAAYTIVVNVFVKVWQLYQERFCKFENYRIYLYRASYHESKGYLKRKVTGTEDLFIADQYSRADILRHMDHFPPTLQRIASLCYFENLPLDQVANTLQLSPSDVKTSRKKVEELLAVVFHH